MARKQLFYVKMINFSIKSLQFHRKSVLLQSDSCSDCLDYEIIINKEQYNNKIKLNLWWSRSYLQRGGGVTQDLISRESSTRMWMWTTKILRACRNLRQVLFHFKSISWMNRKSISWMNRKSISWMIRIKSISWMNRKSISWMNRKIISWKIRIKSIS